MEHWIITESEHYVFHCKENSFAHKNIAKIVEEQERRFSEITNYFFVFSKTKTDYFLCDSREEVGELTDDEPCNALCWYDDENQDVVRLYAVYNEKMQCTGYHEETHAITHFINEPSSSALAEGIAVFMEKTWWGVDIDLCTYIYLQEKKYISVEHLIGDSPESDDEYFYKINSAISYPIMGSFVSFLLSKTEQGKDGFLKLYKYKGNDWRAEFKKIYGVELSNLEKDFVDYIRQLKYTEEEIKFGKAKIN